VETEEKSFSDTAWLDRLVVVLVATRNPLNIGAAARAMSNFGITHLRVVNPYDVAFREARSAVGAAELLARAEEYQSVSEAVEDCSLVVGTTGIGHREPQHPLYVLAEGAARIRGHLETGNVALLFGSEKRGLSNEDLAHCNWLIHIPTRPEHYSMNLGQAVAICLYELIRESRRAPIASSSEPAASAGDYERISTILIEALDSSGYIQSQQQAVMEEDIRRLVRRLQLSDGDAKTWLGIFRKMVWKLRSESHS
jgi:tRNA/rRNA methyltransferase